MGGAGQSGLQLTWHVPGWHEQKILEHIVQRTDAAAWAAGGGRARLRKAQHHWSCACWGFCLRMIQDLLNGKVCFSSCGGTSGYPAIACSGRLVAAGKAPFELSPDPKISWRCCRCEW